MGPFELMDLVGVDVGFEVSKSFYEQSLRRAALAALAARRAHGRRRPPRAQDRRAAGTTTRDGPAPARRPRAARAGRRRRACVVVAGDGALAERAARGRRAGAGWDVRRAEDADGRGRRADPRLRRRRRATTERRCRAARSAMLCAEGSLAALDPGGSAAGFHALPPLERGAARRAHARARRRPTLGRASAPSASSRTLGKHVEWVGDAPGLVLGPDRLPARQRGGVRARRGRRQRRRTSTPAWCSASTTRAARSQWGDAIGLDHVLAVLDGAVRRVPRGALPPRAALLRAVRGGNTAPILSAGCTYSASRCAGCPSSPLLLAAAGAARRRAGRRSARRRWSLPGDAHAAAVRADAALDRRRQARRRRRRDRRPPRRAARSAPAPTSSPRGRARELAARAAAARPAPLRRARTGSRTAMQVAAARPARRHGRLARRDRRPEPRRRRR